MNNYYYRKLKAKKNRGVVPFSHSHGPYHTIYDAKYDFATVNIATMTCPICKTNNIKQYSRHCPICGIKFSYKIFKGRE